MGFFDSFSNAFNGDSTDRNYRSPDNNSNGKSDKDHALTLVKRYTSTAETYLNKADREYAYYKNGAFGDPQKHYLASQQSYMRAKETAEKTLETMRQYNIVDSDLSSRLNAIITKCNNSK